MAGREPEGRPRWAAVPPAVLLVMATVSAGVAAEPWLQAGFDAARTGATADPGPERFDVALRLSLAGNLSANAPVLLLDRNAYVLLSRAMDEPADAPQGLWRIGLDTAQVELLVPVEGDPIYDPYGDLIVGTASGLASDGERFFMATSASFGAFRVTDGEALWTWPLPDLPSGAPNDAVCREPAVRDGVVYVACTEYRRSDRVTDMFAAPIDSLTIVAALDAATGDERWLWTSDVRSGTGSPASDGGAAFRSGPGWLSLVDDVVLIWDQGGARVFAPSTPDDLSDTSSPRGSTLWALDLATGEPLWHVGAPLDTEMLASSAPGLAGPITGFSFLPAYYPPPTTGGEGAVFVKFERLLVALDLTTGQRIWETPLQQSGEAKGWITDVAGLTAGSVIVSSFGSLYSVDRRTGQEQWRYDAGVAPEWGWGTAGGVTTNKDRAFAHGAIDPDRRLLVALDLGRGIPISVMVVPGLASGPLADPAVGEGVLAYVSDAGELFVLGRTGASIGLVAPVADSFPAPGDEVVVDVSGTAPGAQDPDTEFRIDWGDGTTSEWQRGTRFGHTYSEPGLASARVEARNAAGQTASIVLSFDVGGTPSVAEEGFVAAVRSAFTGSAGPLLWLLAGLFVLASIVAVGSARRARAAPQERLVAYRRAVEQEVRRGTPSRELAEHLKPLRAVLSVSDREHAQLEAEARNLHAAARGRGRDLVPGERFLDRYEVLSHLGSGGGGSTYLCRDTRLSRQIVLKVLNPGSRTGADGLLREARAFAALRHENVVTLHDVEQVGDDVFLVLEHVERGALTEHLRERPLPPAEIRRLAEDLLGALGCVHAAGLVHRDVKPGNVLLTAGGRFKLADFGAAHLPGGDATATGLGALAAVGTLRYMSPEQARGERVDARSDLYSAALTLYEAWSGAAYLAPHEGETLLDVQMRVATGQGSLDPGPGPSRLREFFARALEVEPEDRFQTADQMRVALLDALRGAEASVRSRSSIAARTPDSGKGGTPPPGPPNLDPHGHEGHL